jgi:hypothetical protein
MFLKTSRMQFSKYQVFLVFFIFFATDLPAQSSKMFRAAVIQDGTKEKVQEAIVENLRTGAKKRTDNFGLFEIPASLGDSLIIYKVGYQDVYHKVTAFEDTRIYIKLSNQLLEVEVNAQKKASENFTEASGAYSKEKGIFYGGKPPIALLSPFGGSPVTFFYELFSKDAKRVKRLNQLAAKALIEEEIGKRFNPAAIKAAVPIKEEEIDTFRDNYPPKVEELRKWSDFQLIQYIKESFYKFKKKP